MKLSSILKDYPVLSVSDRPIAEAFLSGQMEQQIHSIDYDSRRVSAGSLFFCLPGAHADGHRFAPLAYAAGCVLLYAAVGLSRSRKTRCRYLWRIRATR